MAIENSDLLIVQKAGGELRKASFEDLKSEVLTDVPEAPEGGIPEAPDDGNQYARQNKAWSVVDTPTATPTQRLTITVSDPTQSVFNTAPIEITSGSELIYLNGTLLTSGGDYDVTGNSEVTLATNAVLGDIFELFSNNEITGERVSQNLGYQKSASSGVVTITDGSNAVIDGATTADAGLLIASDKNKLDNIESGAQVNINADWNATSGDAEILNKPTIPTATSDLTNDSGFITIDDVPENSIPEAPSDDKQYARKNEAWAEVDIPAGFSGDYNDLTNKPTIGTGLLTIITADGTTQGTFGANDTGSTTITLPEGFSGDYDDLTNKPNSTLRVTITVSSDTQSVFDTSPVTITSGSELVYLNGALLNSGTDYDVTGDSEITVDTAAVLGDVFELFSNSTITGERVKQNLGYQKRASSGVVTITDGGNAVIDGATTADAGLLTAADKTKLNGIEQGAEVNVQSDWIAPDSSDAHIKNKPTIGSGTLTVKNSDGSTAGTFGANQTDNTTINLPEGFSGDYNDLDNLPTIGTGILTINNSDGSTAGTFGANQTNNTTIDLPEGFSGDYTDLDNKPTIGTGTLTVKNSDGSNAGTFGANQTTNTTITLPEGFSGDYDDLTNKPDSVVTKIVAGAGVSVNNGGIGEVTVTSTVDQLEFGGSADVTSSTVPSTTFNAVPLAIADFYVNVGSGKFSSQWAAVTDNATTDTDADPGDYLVYNGSSFEHIPSGTPPSADPNWIAAGGTLEPVNKNNQLVIGNDAADVSLDITGKASSTATTSTDGSTTLTTKGYVDGLIPTVGEGTLTINLPDGSSPTFGANQSTNTTIDIPEPFSGDYGDLTNKPTIGTGTLTVTQGGDTVGTFNANATGNSTIDVAAPFSGDYDDLTNKPNIGNGTLTIAQGGTAVGTFNANSTGNVRIDVDAPFSGDYNDLSNRPTIGTGTLTIKDGGGNTLGTFGANQTNSTTINLPDSSGDLTDVTPDDINYKHPDDGAVQRTLQSKLEEFVSVKDFGAVGDNTTDDTVAINAALDWWSAGPYRHLHFPAGIYKYNGTKKIDFGFGGKFNSVGSFSAHTLKLTMDGSITLPDINAPGPVANQRVFVFSRLLYSEIQMNVDAGGYFGGLGNDDTFTESEPRNGGTVFLTIEAAYYTKIKLVTEAYEGRLLHCTDFGSTEDEYYNGFHRNVFIDVDIACQGRLYGIAPRVGQAFYMDSGQNRMTGGFGSFKWIGGGYWYGSVIEGLNDVRMEAVEAGDFVKSAGLEIRGSANVHADTIFLGETININDYNDSTLDTWYRTNRDGSRELVDRSSILLNITSGNKPMWSGGSFERKSCNIFIDKLNLLIGGVGLNIENTEPAGSGIIISQLNSTKCNLPINITDSACDVSIQAVTASQNGVLLRKYSPSNSDHNAYYDINFSKPGQFIFNNDSAIEIVGPHLDFVLSGNIYTTTALSRANADSPWPAVLKLEDDCNVTLQNAIIGMPGFGGFPVWLPSSSNPNSNNLRCINTTFNSGGQPFNSSPDGARPKYAQGCKGYQTEQHGSVYFNQNTDQVQYAPCYIDAPNRTCILTSTTNINMPECVSVYDSVNNRYAFRLKENLTVNGTYTVNYMVNAVTASGFNDTENFTTGQ